MPTNGDLVAAAVLTQVGVPFFPQGRQADKGLDCVGLTLIGALGAGLELEHPNDYSISRGDYSATLLEYARRHCTPIEQHPSVGDLVLFSVEKPDEPKHIGVLVESDVDEVPFFFVHAAPRHKRVMRDPLDERWRKYVHSFWRFKWQQSH